MPKKKSLPLKPWAFLAYIAGDNNLSQAGVQDIEEMCRVGASPARHAGVQFDSAGEFDGVIRYEITEPDATGEAHRTVVSRLQESDSGAPRTLRDFLKWGLGRYPATNRLVVVWNHGSGFRTRSARRDIAFDDAGTSLDMPEIDWAMQQAGVGGTPSKRIQILGFDACLMNMVEVVHHLRGRARYIVGSEQTEPNDGWPYDDVLASLGANTSPAQVARAIVAAYTAFYRAAGETGVTQSAVDTDLTPKVIESLSNLGRVLVPVLPTLRSQVSLARGQVQSYEDYSDYVDLIHLTELVGAKVQNAAVKAAAKTLKQRAGDAVIASDCLGASVANSHGLSVWFPADRSTYVDFRSKYMALAFARTSNLGWVEFLDAFHA